jgi:hypothetical protein
MAGATDVVIKAILEPDFRELLLSNPDRALSGYRLSSSEAATLRRLDARRFNEAISQIDRTVMSRLRAGGRSIGDARVKALDYPVINIDN